MQIGLNGWDNLQTRSAGIIEAPDKVFIERDGKTPFGPSYEYSTTEPAHFDIDSVLNGVHGRQNFIELFYCLPEIFAPVNEIASRVADATWQLKKSWNDEVDYADKDFNRLFSKPNPLMSFKQFIWQSVCYEILTGANYEYFNKPSTLADDYRNILSWWNMPTQFTVVNKKSNVDIYSATEMNDFILNYKVGNRLMDTKNVLPIVNHDLKSGNTVDAYRSPLCGAKLAIKNLLPVYEARGVIYIKRGALGFIVSRKSDDSGLVSLTPKEKKEAQDEFQNTYGLRAEKNQVGVTAAPVDFVKTSMSIQELQPFEETLADAVAIYKVLRVPKHLVPSKDNSTFANADADMKSFYSDVIIPIANRYAESWTCYFNIDRKYIFADFSHIDVLQENKKEKADVDKVNSATWLERWKNGACSLNDWIVSFIGTKGTGPIYEKKLFELTLEELATAKEVIAMHKTAADQQPQQQDNSQPQPK